MSYSAKPANEKRLYVKSFCNIFFAEEKLVSPYFFISQICIFLFLPICIFGLERSSGKVYGSYAQLY